MKQAFHVSGLRTEGETVNLALEEFIKRRAMENKDLLEYDCQ
jgi:hypothetical protein